MDKTSSEILDGRDTCKNCANALISNARQRVYLIGQNLEAELYHEQAINDHLTQLATHHRQADIRIIANDTRLASHQGHYLIHLAQKLPSFVQIRITVNPQHRKFSECWLIVDDNAFMRIKNPARYEGYYDTDNKLECKNLTEEFLEIWEASEPDQNTRRLSI